VPQPKLPAPLASRPDPGIQLVEAVRQRQAQRSLQLAQHWVHRRGVLDLQRFCSTRLASAEGPAAVAWLHELLALDTTLPAPVATAPQAAEPAEVSTLSGGRPEARSDRASADAPSPVEAPVSTAAPQPEAGTAPRHPQEQGSPALLEAQRANLDAALQARAVAAVDEAFAALAETFRAETAPPVPTATSASSTSAPVVVPAADSLPEPQPASPQPLPVRGGLWPSLRASAASLGSALRSAPANATSQAEAAEPADVVRQEVLRPEVPATPPPPERPGAAPAAPAQLVLPTATLPEPADQEGEQGPMAAAAEGEASLLGRLRDSISIGRLPRLSRLQALLHDCVEETVALLRAPEPEPSDVDGDFETTQGQAPKTAGKDPGTTVACSAR